MKDDGSVGKIAAHAAVAGILSQITGNGFTSGAAGAGLNEALIKSLKGLDPGLAQMISGLLGAAAAKVAGGNALAGASAAISGTKWNYFLMSRPKEFGISELAKNILRKKDGRELSEEEVDAFLRESNNILSDMEPDLGLDKENPFAEDINNYQKVIRYLEIHGVAKDSAMRFFTAYNETVRNRDWTGVYNKPGSIDVIWDSKKNKLVDVRPPIPVYNPFDTRTYQEGQIIGSGASSGTQKVEGNNNPLETGTSQGHSVGSPTKYPSKENTTFSTEHEAKGSPSTTTRPSQENKRDKANDQSKAALGKTVANTEERIHWGRWQHNPRIAENPKEDTEQEHSDEDNTATTIQKNDVNNKDSKGNRSNDKQGEKTRGNSTETTGNPKDNSKKENTDPNREKRVELGKTIGIETFKFGGDLPVTLLNKQADSLAKEYRSLQKEIPAYVVKQGRLTKVGVLSPLGLIYDTYQDAQKYNGGKFVGAVAINTGAFVGTILLDSALTSTGVGAIGVIPTNVFVAEGTTWLKEKVLDEPKVEEKH